MADIIDITTIARRRLATAARLFGLGAATVARSGEAAPIGPNDARLFALAESVRQADARHLVASDAHSIAQEAGDMVAMAVAEVAWDAAAVELSAALRLMADTPADTLAGVLVKAVRLAHAMRPETAFQVLYDEQPLGASFLDDLPRLAPGVAL